MRSPRQHARRRNVPAAACAARPAARLSGTWRDTLRAPMQALIQQSSLRADSAPGSPCRGRTRSATPASNSAVVILRRNHAAHDHQNVLAAQLPSTRRSLPAPASCARPPGSKRRARGRRSPPPCAPLRAASGTAGRRPRRSPGRRTPWRSLWRRGRARPAPSWPPGCAAGGLPSARTPRPAACAFWNSGSPWLSAEYTPEMVRFTA